MGLELQPMQPWSAIGLSLLLLTVVVYIYQWLRGKSHNLALDRRARRAIIFFSGAAGIFFALALLNPVSTVTSHNGHERIHIATIIDVSDSTMRFEGWNAISPQLYQLLNVGLNSLTAEQRENGSASLLTVAGNISVDTFPLNDLLHRFSQVRADQFAAGSGSKIGAAIEQAVALIRQSGGQGLIVLASDGFDTENKLPEAAQQAARQGIPIWVIPFGSSRSDSGLSSVYLPPDAIEGEPTLLRALISNDSSSDLSVDLRIRQYSDVADASPLETGGTFTFTRGSYASIRESILFTGVGLRPLDISIQTPDTPDLSTRRLYTHVTRPLRILAVGGDFRWVSGMRPGFAYIDQVRAEELSTTADLSLYDAVVLNAVSGTQITPDNMARLAKEVEMQAVGLFVVNGNHGNSQPEASSVLHSLQDTAIGPLLPVSTLPRPYTPEPPPRQVVILLDVSGSMEGNGLQKEKDLTAHIVQNLLRPVDTLDIILFDTEPHHLIINQRMDDAGKQNAINSLSRIGIGGGTDPSSALRLIQERSFTECGLIIMSDGGFDGASLARVRPDCHITALEIGSSLVFSSGLSQLADPIAVPYNFNPENLEIPFFEHDERARFFEPGNFPLLSTEQLMGFSSNLDLPEVEINGSAIAFLCDLSVPDNDPGCLDKRSRATAQTYAIRPKWRDPMLAFGNAGLGTVGIFASAWDSEWRNDAGNPIIESWIEKVTGYSARDRYSFWVEEDGDTIRVIVSVKNTVEGLPIVTAMSASIHWDGDTFPMVSHPQQDTPSTFILESKISRKEIASLGVLELRESGPDALQQTQRIPIMIAPAISALEPTDEAGTFGVNEGLLQYVAALTGGVYAPADAVWFQTPPAASNIIQAYWPGALVMAAICYLIAIGIRRIYSG